MPQVILAGIFEYLGATAATATFLANAIVVAASIYAATDAQRRAQNAAKDAYNNSLRDRYVMIRGATEPRQMVLGRQRVSGPMFFVGSYGANKEHLVFTLALAAHEIDAIEAIYFDDEKVALDGAGNVLGVNRHDAFSITTSSATFALTSAPIASTVTAIVRYGSSSVNLGVSVSGSNVTVTGATSGQVGTVTITYRPDPSPYLPTPIQDYIDPIFLDANGNGSNTIRSGYIAGSAHAVAVVGEGDNREVIDLTPYLTVSGSTATITNSPAPAQSMAVTVSYQTSLTLSKARIRQYLGTSTQTSDGLLQTYFPGTWTSSHKATNIAYLVVELDYDQDAFPSGIPNVSALVRGAKVYDPRNGSTVWSENPALLMRHAATSPLCGRLSTSLINDASIIAEANICDVSSAYVVNGQTYTRPRYTAGLTVKSTTRPSDVLNDLSQAMCGKWGFIDGQLRVRAGSYVTPAQTLTESWLMDSQPVHIQPRANRSEVFNVATGKFADESSDYQVLDFPRVASTPYITEDGQEMPLDIQLNAVTFTGQAQQIVTAMMKDARQGMRLVVQCNMRAYPVEIFDTINVTLSRFGFVNKPFEVIDVKWTIDGGIQLTLKEVDSTAWNLGASFSATDPAPNTTLRSPFDVEIPSGVTLASGTDWLLKQKDGTIITRMRVGWNALVDEAVLNHGSIEVRYGMANLPEDQWQSVIVPGTETQAILTDLQDRALYLVKLRSRNSLVWGKWSLPYLTLVIGKSEPPGDVANLARTIVQSGVRITWTQNTEVDYDHTELRLGSSWSVATPLFTGAADSFTWLSPSVGTYTVWAKHYDTTGNQSANAVSVSVAVDSTMAVQWANLVGKPKYFRAVSKGALDTTGTHAAGFFNGETDASISGVTTTRSYMMARVRRSDGAVTFARQYDVDGSGAIGGFTAATLAADLNASTASDIVVVWTSDNPQGNRLTSGLDTAMYRCGASRAVFGSPQFKLRSAYVLVGIGGCGEGNGFEAYNGSIDSDTNAWCDISFQLLSGTLIVTGTGATPRTLADYSYTGDLNATSDIRLVARGNCVTSGNQASKVGGSAAWDSDVYSLDGYTGGAFASASAKQTTAQLMFGLNSDPATDGSYTSLDYAIFLHTDGTMEGYESGSSTGTLGAYAVNDVLAILYDGARVLYLRNGTVLRTVNAAAGLKLFFDSSFNTPGGALSNIRFGPQSAVTNIGTGQLQGEAATSVYVAPHVATATWSSSE